MLLSKILPDVAQKQPHHYAMKHNNTTLTYDQLLHRVGCVARGFFERNVKPGDRVVLLGDPCPSLAIAELAAVAVGALPVTLFSGLTPHEMSEIVKDAAPAAVVFDTTHAAIAECVASLDGSISLIPIQHEATSPSIAASTASALPLTVWHEADPDDIAVLIYTGGTTGRAKGVMHSHRSIRSWSFLNPERGGGHNPTKQSLVSNQAHLSGQFILWSTLFEGGCLVYPDRYPLNAETVLEIVQKEQFKFIGTAGLLFRDIVDIVECSPGKYDFVEGISFGGCPISEKTLHRAHKAFPNAQLIGVYSQTESGQFISMLSVNACLEKEKPQRLLSVGNPAHVASWGQKPLELRIVDDSGEEKQPGEVGEIICKGDSLMLGYWNQEDQTREALRDGWLYTGDIGMLDEDGYLYLLDRKKDIILVGGSNVYGSEVEEVLGGHPFIAEVAVIGTPLPEEGEEITAVVTLQAPSALSLNELREFCRHRLASYKLPTRLEIVETLARTLVGKIDKTVIRKSFI